MAYIPILGNTNEKARTQNTYTPILGNKKQISTTQDSASVNWENLVPNPVLNDYGSSQTTQAIPDSTTGSTIDALKEVGNIGIDIAKGLARIPAEYAVTAGQTGLSLADRMYGTNYTQNSVGTVVPKGFMADILGSEPIKGYGKTAQEMQDMIHNSPIAKKYGLDKHATVLAIGGTVAEEVLNFMGGDEKTAGEVVSLLRKIPDTEQGVSDAYHLLRNIGIEADIGKSYAPLVAKETTEQGIKDILDGAIKLQKETKAYEPILGSAKINDIAKPQDPLIQEAKKYETADEFVKSQTKVFHSGDLKGEIDITKGKFGNVFFVSNKAEFAKSFGSKKAKLTEFIINPNANLIDLQKVDDATFAKIKSVVDKRTRIFDSKGRTIKQAVGEELNFTPFSKSQVLQGIKDGKAHFAEIPDMQKVYKELGFDGMITAESPFGAKNIGVFNKDILKTKSQLTDIFNKAKAQQDIGKIGQLTKPEAHIPKVDINELLTQETTAGKQTQKVIKDVTGKKVSPFIRKKETTLLKEKIKNIQRGVREGTISTKKDIATNQKELTNLIKSSNLEAKDKTKFLSTIKNVQTTDQLKKALPVIQKRISKLEETATHNSLLSSIKKELTAPLTRKVGSTHVSKYSPETTRILKEYRTDVSYKNPENAITQLRLNKLQATEKWHLENPNEYMPDSVLEKLQELNRKHLPLLSNDELAQELANIQSLKTQGKTFQRITIEKASNDRAKVIGVMKDIIGAKSTGEVVVPESNNLLKRTGVELKKLHLSMLNSDTLFDTLDEGAKSNLNAGKINTFFQNASNKSRDVELIGTKNDLKQVQKLMQDNGITKDMYKKSTFNIGGKKVQLDRKSMIGVYIAHFDKAQLASMLEGNHIPTKSIDEIISQLKPNEKAFGDGLLKLYSDWYDVQNAVYRKINFMDMPRNEFYSRMFKDMRYVQNEDINIAKDNLAYAKASVRKGMTKARTGSLAPIKLDAIDNIMRYITEKNHYVAWELPVKEMNSVMKGISGDVASKYGSDYVKVMNEWLKRVAGDGRYDSTALNKTLLATRRGLTKSLITNFITPLKQTISLSSFLTEISEKDLALGIEDYTKNTAKWNEFWSEVPQIQNRGETLTRDIGAISKNRSAFNKLAGNKSFGEVGVAPVRFFDKLTVRSGATAVYKRAIKDGLSEEQAISKTIGVVRRTQITGDIKDLSAMQSGGALEKLLTMFQNQPNKYYNILYQNLRGYAIGRVGKVQLGRALLYSWVIPAIAYEEFSKGGTASLEDNLKAVLTGPFIDILVAGNIFSSIKSGFNYSASPIETLPNEFISSMKNLNKGEILKSFSDIVKIGAQVKGLPVNQPIRTYKGLQDITSGKTNDWRRLIWSKYALGVKKEKKQKKIYMPIPHGLPSLNSTLPKLPKLPSLLGLPKL